jgi:leucyl-tRNA synthetase
MQLQEVIKEKNLIEENFRAFTNEMVDKVTKNLDSFHYNVIVANFHETYNFLSKLNLSKINNSVLLENYIKILTIMCPIIPHFSSECINEIYKKE